MHQLDLVVDGMDCRHCVREVTARLRDVPGVERVSANPDGCVVQLSGSMELTEVLAAFAGTVYRPQRVGTRSGQCDATAAASPRRKPGAC